jgi:hypothetical protein
VFPIIRKKLSKEVWCIFVCLFCFCWSLLFCIEGGLYTFDLFDGYSGNIQLLFCLLCELAFIPWLFGLEKLGILMKIRTGEDIPGFITIFIKYVIPIFIGVVYVIAWMVEFQYNQGRWDNRWTTTITWFGRLLWILPLLIIPFGAFVYPIETDDIYDLIEKQYGIRFCDNAEGYEYVNKETKLVI